jgi:hypothetical protein
VAGLLDELELPELLELVRLLEELDAKGALEPPEQAVTSRAIVSVQAAVSAGHSDRI